VKWKTGLPCWLALSGALLAGGCASDRKAPPPSRAQQVNQSIMAWPFTLNRGWTSNTPPSMVLPDFGTNSFSRFLERFFRAAIEDQGTNFSGQITPANALAAGRKLLLAADAASNQRTNYPRPIENTNQVGVWVWSIHPKVGAWGGLSQLWGKTPDALTDEGLGAEAAREVSQRLVKELEKTFHCRAVILRATNAGRQLPPSARADALCRARELGLDVLVEFKVHPRTGYGAVFKRRNVRLQARFEGAASVKRVSDNETLWHSPTVKGIAEILIPRLPCTRADAQPTLHVAAESFVDDWMTAFRPGRSFLQLLLRQPDDP
jgi:hypothetical protein